ncbi:pirin family protein [Prauserella cavernicola]|uniref:Pirin family protein n=1 Tax=Prauserella cavernicola TaxID=2800127 RepID=A0A934QME6_9PSEU|nr:pirin family protein [Prauserella cavernicola]MBK1782730.1 pirin family protein [Prauserella cavernicola]
MSNLDVRPEETPCRGRDEGGAVTELLEARTVPLGGVRGIQVDRVLPQRALPTVGAWCFLDQFGPARSDMRVLPHPHIGLQTVTWPLAGEIRHRDSLGSDVVVRPGQLNLMTGGRGVAHSEFSLGDEPELHGLQLWVALPEQSTGVEPAFEQHVALPRFEADGLSATVLVGSLGDAVSPATVYTPLVGAELTVGPGARTKLPLRRDFEYALLVVDGDVTVAGVPLSPGPLLYLGTGRDELEIAASAGARALLLGGEPFPDELVMWWNFVGRSHEEIAEARAAWEAHDESRFGRVDGHGDARIPAPDLPGVRLTPRRRPH